MTKLTISPEDAWHGLSHWAAVATRIGAEISYAPSEFCLPLSDRTAVQFAKTMPEAFMGSLAMSILTDRIWQQNLQGVRVLPAVLPMSNADLAKLPADRPLFIKTRTTYKGAPLPFNYREWYEAELPEAFYEYQRKSVNEYIVQPSLGFPHEVLAVVISVNRQSEVFVADCVLMSYDSHNVFRHMRTVELPADVFNAVHAACQQAGVFGGVHYVEFAKDSSGQWALMDWNVRPYFSASMGIYDNTRVLDGALRHMMGMPNYAPVQHHTVEHWYLDKKIPAAKASAAFNAGMFVRTENGFIRSLGYSSPTEAETTAKFDEVNAILGVTL